VSRAVSAHPLPDKPGRNTRSPVHVVVIPSGREGDQTAGSLEVKALWGRRDLVRSVKGVAGRSVSESGSPERRAPREADCGNLGSAKDGSKPYRQRGVPSIGHSYRNPIAADFGLAQLAPERRNGCGLKAFPMTGIGAVVCRPE
jgi:hypothetical protein